MTEKSPKARKVIYVVFASTMIYLVWCVIIGMGVALYESSPSAEAPRSRATFNQCMRQIVMLSDEVEQAGYAAKAGGAEHWVKWESESYKPRLSAIKRGCNQLGDIGMQAALDSLDRKYQSGKVTAATYKVPSQEPLPKTIRDMTRKGPEAP